MMSALELSFQRAQWFWEPATRGEHLTPKT